MRDDVDRQRRQDQVRAGVAAAAHDDQVAAPGQLGTQRAPAGEARRLLHEHDIRFGRPDHPSQRVAVVAHRADVVGQQAQAGHRAIVPYGSSPPAVACRVASAVDVRASVRQRADLVAAARLAAYSDASAAL